MSAYRFDDHSGDVLAVAPRWIRRRLAARGPAMKGDHGLITVLFGLILSSMLIVAAIVVDLGMDRATVRSLKTDTDLAAVAGGYFMAGHGQTGDLSNPDLACGGALNSIKTNIKDFPSTYTSVPGNGCDLFPTDAAAECDDANPVMKTVTFTGAPYVLTIDYPVPDSVLHNDLFTTKLDDNDGRSPCARMRITLSRANPAVFSGIIGGSTRTITQSTTFKVNAATVGDGVPALLILERLNCQTIAASGQGGIKVAKSGAIGGWIHSDTQALPGAQIVNATGTYTSNCGAPASTACNTSTGNDYSIYATGLPSNGGPAIIAEDNLAADGMITTYAASPSVNGSIACQIGTGINHAAVGNPIVSRTPVDKRYNLGTNPYGENITQLHANGYAATTATLLGGTGMTTVVGFNSVTTTTSDPTGAACSADNKVYTGDKVWINCPSGFTAKNVVFTGRQFVFSGAISIANGFLAFPHANRIYVRGCGAGFCTGISVGSGGVFSINTNSGQCDATAKVQSGGALNCSASFISNAFLSAATDGSAIPSSGNNSQWPYVECLAQANGPGGYPPNNNYDNQAVFATFSGAVNIQNAVTNWCQTFLYIGSNSASYSKAAMTAGGNCSASLPCPSGTANSLQFTLNSGSKPPVQWTAPLHNLKGPDSSAPFDDIALWTEASLGLCQIAGQGAIASSGIFFMPSCPFSYGGQAASNNPVNAQFIVRTLNMAGQGILYLKPNPDQSIIVPHPGGPEIIR